ncbi:MAG: 4'-phosphopantetheinyl transferase superfamily protein, partial [Paludibacter sp.]|nr:4'-phosphopantetheinyl transferase superfamily protein [Paludibacter sp.]
MLLPTTKDIVTIDDAKLLVWEITQSIDELVSGFEDFTLFAVDFEKINSDKRKLEFLGTRWLLKILLEKEINVQYTADGKPYLNNESYHISLSHSGKWMAVMIHPTKHVGIDIECPTDKIQKVYKRFLSETEQAELSGGKDIDIKQLQIAWSAKEALYKIIGKEAVDFANQLRLLPFEVQKEGQITAQHITTNTVYQLTYTQTAAYTLV